MSDYAKTALEILKLAPRYLVSLGIIAAFFLFTPDKTLKWFGIFDFAQHYRAWMIAAATARRLRTFIDIRFFSNEPVHCARSPAYGCLPQVIV
jgi:hypothetical protein